MNTGTLYGYLTNDKVLKGVLDTIVKESPVLARVPFKDHTGNSLLFNIEDSMANVNWYTIGDTWVENTNTWAQGSVALTTMGGDVDTDKFAIKTKGDINDVRAVNITGKAKAMAHEFDRAFILGQTTTASNTKEIKGILKWIANYESTALSIADLDYGNNTQVILNDTTANTPAVLALTKIDELIDAVMPGKPDCLMLNRRTRRYLNVIAYASGSSPIRVDKDQFGEFVDIYNGIPVLINDWIPDNVTDASTGILTIANLAASTTRADGYNRTFIFALRFDEMNGVCGIQNGAMEHEDLGELETKRAYRNRFAWDCAVVMLGKKCASVLINASDVA